MILLLCIFVLTEYFILCILHVGISSHILNNITNNFYIHRLKDQQSNIVQDILLYTRVD